MELADLQPGDLYHLDISSHMIGPKYEQKPRLSFKGVAEYVERVGPFKVDEQGQPDPDLAFYIYVFTEQTAAGYRIDVSGTNIHSVEQLVP